MKLCPRLVAAYNFHRSYNHGAEPDFPPRNTWPQPPSFEQFLRECDVDLSLAPEPEFDPLAID
jgi:hypothetical protein